MLHLEVSDLVGTQVAQLAPCQALELSHSDFTHHFWGNGCKQVFV